MPPFLFSGYRRRHRVANAAKASASGQTDHGAASRWTRTFWCTPTGATACFTRPRRTAFGGWRKGRRPWAIPWPCVNEFVAIATHPRLYAPPSSAAQAFEQLDAWFESPKLVLLGEGPNHLAELKRLALGAQIVGRGIHDARIAALCLQHGVRELWTFDRDFSRFPQLKTRNPLVGPA